MELLLIALVWVIAGFIHGISGFGGLVIAVTFLSLVLPLQLTVPLGIINSLVLNSMLAVQYRKHSDYKIAGFMLLASCPGIALGLYVLAFVPNTYLQFIMGILLLVFVLWECTHKKTEAKDSLGKRALASFASGFAFASTSLGGPPVAVYVLHAGWSPQKILGTTGVLFFFVGLLIIPGLAFADLFSEKLFEYTIVSMLGTAIGIGLSFRFIDKGGVDFFKKCLLIVIFISALLCLYSSIKEMFGL